MWITRTGNLIHTSEENKDYHDISKCVLQWQSLHFPCNKINSVINTVYEKFDLTTKINNSIILVEGNYLALLEEQVFNWSMLQREDQTQVFPTYEDTCIYNKLT